VDLWKDPAFAKSQLVMAGDGPLRHELARSGPANIRWTGFVEGQEKRRLIAGCRAILFPSIWPEPLSTVAYEAYELARPVIASNVGGMKEIVLDGQTGRVLAAANPTAWREAIRQLGDDAGRARTLGEHGRRWLEGNGSPEAWNLEFTRIITTALRPETAGGRSRDRRGTGSSIEV
jgi:glycosyltransferase involved in cell wall biosynthesis